MAAKPLINDHIVCCIFLFFFSFSEKDETSDKAAGQTVFVILFGSKSFHDNKSELSEKNLLDRVLFWSIRYSAVATAALQVIFYSKILFSL
jgi:hypothetical protein